MAVLARRENHVPAGLRSGLFASARSVTPKVCLPHDAGANSISVRQAWKSFAFRKAPRKSSPVRGSGAERLAGCKDMLGSVCIAV